MNEVYPSTWKKILLSELCSKVTDGTHHSPLNESEGDYLYAEVLNVRAHIF
jgi:type I restriction enzyme, S subunit